MLFNSYCFIFLFLPLVLLLYYAAHRLGYHKAALFIITISSFVFYSYNNLNYLALLIFSILFNWMIACFMNRVRRSKVALIIGVAVNIALIFYYKYLDFCIGNINYIFNTDIALRNIILPLGISFFTFQQISFIIDTYSGETEGYSFLEYAAFISFFPQLVAGPIVLHGELIPQYRDEVRWKPGIEKIAEGLYYFSVGISKKVLIADRLGQAVSWTWSDITNRSSIDLIIASVMFSFQLYLDFSGYSDMAIGIGRLFNLDIPVNFNSPYKAVSISDFWKKWHITLTRFLTKYIYFPLGGSRKGIRRTYINILIVFLISGLWHGANWTFILWGLFHGILLIINKHFENVVNRMPKIISWGITFIIVDLLWIMFYAPDVGTCLYVWKTIFSFNGFSISGELKELKIYLAVSCVICFLCRNIHEKEFKPSLGKALFSAAILLCSVTSLTGVSEFLYSNF